MAYPAFTITTNGRTGIRQAVKKSLALAWLRPWSIQKPAPEVSEVLRGLIDGIVLTPNQGELQIELKGNLAAMLGAARPPSRALKKGGALRRVRRSLAEAENAKRSPETGDLSLQVEMVAGARNHLDLEFAWTAA
jgi:hypothetical protein